MKQKQIGRENSIANSTVILGDLHIPFSIIERSVKQNFSKETEGLKNSVTLANAWQVSVDHFLRQQQIHFPLGYERGTLWHKLYMGVK